MTSAYATDVLFLVLLTVSESQSAPGYTAPIYTWPLGNTVGNNEVKHGKQQGSTGDVAFAEGLPELTFDAILFRGTIGSFLDLKVDTEIPFNSDISFTCSVYLDATMQGTIFHYQDDHFPAAESIYRLRLYLHAGLVTAEVSYATDSAFMVTATNVGTVQPTGEWITVALSYDISTGQLSVYINGVKHSFATIEDDLPIALPATIRIGAQLDDGSELLSGRVTCFQIIPDKYDANDDADYKQECHSDNWIVDCSKPCSEVRGFYHLAAVDTIPLTPPTTSHTARSKAQCAALCRMTGESCASFYMNKVSGLCLLYDGNYSNNMASSDPGTTYYTRRNLCCTG